jgi:hypothetical protein
MGTYDDLLRSAHDEYSAIDSRVSGEIASLQETIAGIQRMIEEADSRRAEAERHYHVAVIALAERRLAGEFGEDHNGSGRPSVGGDTDARATQACYMVPNQDDFNSADAYEAVGDPLMKRSTLNGSLQRLVERGFLRIVEQGYKRRATRYAVVAPRPRSSPQPGVELPGVEKEGVSV